MRFIPFLLAASCLLLPTRSHAGAQEAATDQEAFPDSAAIESLTAVLDRAEHERMYLRFTMASQTQYSGYVFAVHADSGWVHVGARRALLSAIERLERRRITGSGSLLGTIVGAVVLGYAGYTLDGECEVYDAASRRLRTVSCDAGWPIGLAGVMVGGILGAVGGYALDRGTTHWEEVWRSAR